MRKLSYLHPFFFYRFSIKILAYFTYAATASKITDDVTKLVMHTVFNTNLYYSSTSFTHIFDRKCKLFDEFK